MTDTDRGSADLMQKLLMPWLVGGILEQGYYHLGGPVSRAADVDDLRRPADLVAAHGLLAADGRFGPAPERVGVLRFPVDPLMELRRPTSSGPRPWPTYEHGFLVGVPVPVWTLERTRVPNGAELWLLQADGEQRLLAVFDGPALGWRGAAGWFPPLHLVGPRAEWQGLDLPAALLPDGGLEIVHAGAEPPRAGFEQVRPDVWRQVLPVDHVQRIFDLTLTCRWRDVDCRVIQHTPVETRLLLLTDEPDVVQPLGGEEVEPGIFELTAPSGEVTDISAVARDLH